MVPKSKIIKPRQPPMIIGWIEHVDLPDLDLHDVRTKIDTGARTSALHATKIERFMSGKTACVRFLTRHSGNLHDDVQIEVPLYDVRQIKNTSGVPEKRIVIRTGMQIGGRTWQVSVSLADRSNMRFQMIVGRSALKHQNIAVHARRANLA